MLNLNFQNGQAPALNARNMSAIVESINTLGYAVGGPNVASTVSEMTDTSKVYVYTGSETGYTAGNWYYYNGSAWVSGGVYQATAVETDTTLTMPGEPADAKATGDAVTELKSALVDAVAEYCSTGLVNPDVNIFSNGRINRGDFTYGPYRIATKEIQVADKDMVFTPKAGFRIMIPIYVNGVWDGAGSGNTFYTTPVSVTEGKEYRLCIAKTEEDTTKTADIIEFCKGVTISTFVTNEIKEIKQKIAIDKPKIVSACKDIDPFYNLRADYINMRINNAIRYTNNAAFSIGKWVPVTFANDTVVYCDTGYDLYVYFWSSEAAETDDYLYYFVSKKFIAKKGQYMSILLRKEDTVSEISPSEAYAIHAYYIDDELSNGGLDAKLKMLYDRLSYDPATNTYNKSTTRLCLPSPQFAKKDIVIKLGNLSSCLYMFDANGNYDQDGSDTSWQSSKQRVIPAGSYWLIMLRNSTNTTITLDALDEVEFDDYPYLTDAILHLRDDFTEIIKAVNGTDIVASNSDAVDKILASRWLRSATAQPFTLLHFSDIHRWEEPLKRIIEFRDYLNEKGILNDTICTGDLVRNSTDEQSAYENFWYGTPGTENILVSIGNHDTYDVGSQPHGKATIAKINSLFFRTVSSWGSISRDGIAPYYYKDYPAEKIRLIVCDPAITDDEMDETAWLINALESARVAGYAVIVASHFLRAESVTIYDNPWSNNLARETATDSMRYDWDGCDIVSCVTDFISNGGKFVCYLIGHTHTDIASYPTGHPDQLILNVCCASWDRSHETPLTTNDLPRYDGTRTQDAFNIVTVDAENGILKVVRVGSDVTMHQERRKAFSYNFFTHQFINIY